MHPEDLYLSRSFEDEKKQAKPFDKVDFNISTPVDVVLTQKFVTDAVKIFDKLKLKKYSVREEMMDNEFEEYTEKLVFVELLD